MGLRFRRSMTLLPGVRLNFGLHSMSISTGVKGFRRTVSTTGRVTKTISIPGTGISYVTTSNRNRSSRSNNSRNNSNNRIPVDSLQLQSQNNYANDDGTRSRTDEVQRRQEEHARIHVEELASLDEKISSIYSLADDKIDWKSILISNERPEYYSEEEYAYYKGKAENVINGDIDEYFALIQDINPFNDLQDYGAEFDFGTDDPRSMTVNYVIKKDVLDFGDTITTEEKNINYQDFVCGTAIRVARDLFALLPLREVAINVQEKRIIGNNTILSVAFDYNSFSNLNFNELDPSDTIESYKHNMDFNAKKGFNTIKEI